MEQLRQFNCKANERLGLFKVFDSTDQEVILGEDDKHLNFRISLYKTPVPEQEGKYLLTITTAVYFKNTFGKIYFRLIKPFHQLIVPRMLKGILKELNKQFDFKVMSN